MKRRRKPANWKVLLGCIVLLFALAVLSGSKADRPSSHSKSPAPAATAAPTATPAPTPTAEPTPAPLNTYVLNTNTMKFHSPKCKSVKDILPKNREDYEGTRDEVLEMGYKPCKRCKP